MSTTIEDRLILLLRQDGEPHGYWQGLERNTGISAARWRKTYTRQQRPTTDMLSAICRLRPQYAFWLATGITDAANGHTAPVTALTFPEMPRHKLSDPHAENYFLQSLELNRDLYRAVDPDLDDDSRLKTSETTLVGTQRWGSDLVREAYAVADQTAYRKLIEQHELREKHRQDKTRLPKKPANSAATDKIGLQDPRTAHQGQNDLFWKVPDMPAQKHGNHKG